VITDLLGAPVVAVEAFTDPPEATLFPAERVVIARAVDQRRREFTTVRWCARSAMARLGLPAAPVLPGFRGAPQWPAGVIGSMTHCAGYRAAALARAQQIATIGVDAEPNEPLPPGVLSDVALPEERAWLAPLAQQYPTVCWDRLVFSAKESVYKSWFPLTHRWLDFGEVVLTLSPQTRTFQARLLVPGPVLAGVPVTGFSGRWLVANGLILTAIVVAATVPGQLP
jgi:4'-phosphopantetheinyl transferase EntD